MEQLLDILVWLMICVSVVWLAKYALDAFRAPLPAYWVVGLIVLIFFLTTISGHGAPGFHLLR